MNADETAVFALEIQLGIYKHFKGNYYLVEGVALEAGKEDQKDRGLRVVYRKLYDDFGLRHRPIAEFVEEVDRPEFNYKGSRFKLVFLSPPNPMTQGQADWLVGLARIAEACPGGSGILDSLKPPPPA